jgi:hypothetical protein
LSIELENATPIIRWDLAHDYGLFRRFLSKFLVGFLPSQADLFPQAGAPDELALSEKRDCVLDE